jgi:predicted nucleotidyltransferase
MGVDETLLNEIVRRILSVARPDKIILFGSAATGQMTRDSDIDLLIVEQDARNTADRWLEISNAIGQTAFPVDLKLIRTDRFEATKSLIGGIAYPANRYGRVLYAAA